MTESLQLKFTTHQVETHQLALEAATATMTPKTDSADRIRGNNNKQMAQLQITLRKKRKMRNLVVQLSHKELNKFLMCSATQSREHQCVYTIPLAANQASPSDKKATEMQKVATFRLTNYRKCKKNKNATETYLLSKKINKAKFTP